MINVFIIVLCALGLLIVIGKLILGIKYGKASSDFIKSTEKGDEVNISMGDGIYKSAKVIENNGDTFKLEVVMDSRKVSAPDSFYKNWLSKRKIVSYLFKVR